MRGVAYRQHPTRGATVVDVHDGRVQRGSPQEHARRDVRVRVVGQRRSSRGGPPLIRPRSPRPVDVVDVEVERLLLVDEQRKPGVRDVLGAGGPPRTRVVGDGRHDHAGDVDLVAAPRLTLVLPVDQGAEDGLLLESLQSAGTPDLGNEVVDRHPYLHSRTAGPRAGRTVLRPYPSAGPAGLPGAPG